MRLLAGAAAILKLLLFAYGVAAGVGSTIAVNERWRPPARPALRDVTVFVEDNGVHTSIVLPKRAAGVDWRRAFPGADLGDPRYAGWDHVAVSWGERGFFVGTPTWWDLRPGDVLRAMLGSEAVVLHVEHVAPPVEGPGVKALVLRPAEYRRLAAFVLSTLRPGEVVRGYAGYDAFYPARGRYDWRRTCNAWTGEALASAGARVGAWTPTAAGVMRWL